MFTKPFKRIFFLGLLVLVAGLLHGSRGFAQPTVCIPYIPIIATVNAAGNLPSGTGCSTTTVSVDMGQPLVGEPIISLRNWRLAFQSERHFGVGVVQLLGHGIAGNSVVLVVQGCLEDDNNGQNASWSSQWEVAAWAQDEYFGFPPP